MNCPFCNQPCPIEYEFINSNQFRCQTCKAGFNIKYLDQKLIRANFLQSNPDNSQFLLVLNYINNTTSLIWYPNDTSANGNVILIINHTLLNVNPQNLNNKIKTLITYS